MANNELALIYPSDLSLVEDNALSGAQLKQLLKKTPAKYVHTRPAKGGGTWEYVTGGYVKKVLNIMFGWNWSFEIMDEKIIHGEVIVKGKLTCNSNGITVVKMQYGNKDIICKKNTDIPLSIGNDLKSAATDALKKCAAEIGIAADIYNKMDFNEVNVYVEPAIDINDLKELYELKKEALGEDDIINAERIINNLEKNSYSKLFKSLQSK